MGPVPCLRGVFSFFTIDEADTIDMSGINVFEFGQGFVFCVLLFNVEAIPRSSESHLYSLQLQS